MLCGGGYYTLGNNDIHNSRGNGDSGLEKNSNYSIKASFYPFHNESSLSGTLSVYAEIQV